MDLENLSGDSEPEPSGRQEAARDSQQAMHADAAQAEGAAAEVEAQPPAAKQRKAGKGRKRAAGQSAAGASVAKAARSSTKFWDTPGLIALARAGDTILKLTGKKAINTNEGKGNVMREKLKMAFPDKDWDR